jgi:hypothetical protein
MKAASANGWAVTPPDAPVGVLDDQRLIEPGFFVEVDHPSEPWAGRASPAYIHSPAEAQRDLGRSAHPLRRFEAVRRAAGRGDAS